MSDEGKYMQLWKKYVPVIRVLLKKSATGDQKLKLYRHEIDSSGVKTKAAPAFNIEMVNGKVTNKISGSGIAKDLVQAMNETPEINEWLKTRSVKISMGKSLEVIIQNSASNIVIDTPKETSTVEETLDAAKTEEGTDAPESKIADDNVNPA